ncbi:MAG TPA: iron-sulfur cluster repair di-iron protein [Vicinamibacterales bacterium]|nr:iron-sulfur cluster repair di-iron protein [Vicinamibacterales bacterium]
MSEVSGSILHARLADIVLDDPRCTPVFDRLGLDYCCRGQRTLLEASEEQHVPISEVLGEIHALGPRLADSDRAAEWPDLTALIHHILSRHHHYVREHEPVIRGLLDKLVNRHGDRHPELFEARATFNLLSQELLQHMEKEEKILFPFIESLSVATADGPPQPGSPFGTIMNPIRAMEHEHLVAGTLMARLRTLTRGFEPPADACMSYRLCFSELAEFESDLHTHVHLENYVLFPRAVALENAL